VTHLVLTGTLAGLTDDAMLAQLIAGYDPNRPFDGRTALAADFPAREPVRTFLYEQIAGLNPPLAPEMLRALIALRYSEDVERLHMPVCFIAGERDQLFPPALVRQAHAKVPGAQLVMVPEAGHSVYFERADAFNAALASFLGIQHT
jgi:pimeloyl-ACP methyl ester carboxylesterase